MTEEFVLKIALISDTHIPSIIPELPSKLVDHLQAVDLIIHAGDFECLDVLEMLRPIAQTVAVYGNVDEPDVVHQLPRKHFFSLARKYIGLIHGHQSPEIEREYLRLDSDYDSSAMKMFYEYLAYEFPMAEIIIFGHFHVSLVKYWGNQLLINPGSIAPHRGHRSFGLLKLSPLGIKVKIIEL